MSQCGGRTLGFKRGEWQEKSKKIKMAILVFQNGQHSRIYSMAFLQIS
jgi:hypothetical protein